MVLMSGHRGRYGAGEQVEETKMAKRAKETKGLSVKWALQNLFALFEIFVLFASPGPPNSRIGSKPEMRPMNVELHIEELVLHGFAPGDRHHIGEAVERELARLLAEQGALHLFGGNVELERMDAGEFNLRPNTKSEMIGAQVAQAVYERMTGGIGR